MKELAFFILLLLKELRHETPAHVQINFPQGVHSGRCLDASEEYPDRADERRHTAVSNAVLQTAARIPVCDDDQDRQAEAGILN